MLTAEQIRKVGNFDQDTIDALARALGGVESVSAAGALSLHTYESKLTISGTMAFTLAAPEVEGQRKKVTVDAASSTPVGTLTVSSPDDTTGFVCQATFVLDTAGQELIFEATAALKWRCIGKKRAGIITGIDAGTTSLTGKSMAATYSLAVTDTDTAGSTTVLPNGSVVGERCNIVCESVSGTPVGNVAGTFVGMFGTAYTSVGAIGVAASATVVGDTAVLVWTGSAWRVEYQNGCTLS